MPEMRQCTADPHGEDRPESWTTVLGMLGVSEVPDDAELIELRDDKESWSVPKCPNALPPCKHRVAYRKA